MKKIIKLLLVLFPVMAIAQTTTQNYIKTSTYKQEFIEGTVPINPTPAQAAQNTTYFDGLGRPIQQIAGQQSNTGKDIITHIKYDSFGRQTEEYLPFKSANTNMAFDPLAEANVLSYYASPNPVVNGNPAMEATTNPYSKKELEASPLNRVLRQAAPGNDWSLGSGHEIKMDYQTNVPEEVKLFTANASWDAGSGLYAISFSNNNYYAPNQLYKTVTYDENTAAVPAEANGSTVEFKNKEGQVVLKRTYGTVGAGSANEKHDTYYVYDIYGNLTYVIPPKAVDLIGASTGIQPDVTSVAVVAPGTSLSLTATNSIRLLPGFHAQTGSTFSAVIDNGTQGTLDNLCYQYKYDHRNRLVEKKLPGKQWEFIVYDKLDRPVATGPANSPFSDIATAGWLITKYDAFNRPVYTGWASATAATAAGRASLQAAQNNPALTTINESKQSSGTLDGIAAYYTNVVAPVAFKLLTVNYYDNYSFPDAPIISATLDDITDQKVYYNTTIKPIGLATGTWIRVPETSTSTRNEQSYTLYDAKAKPVKSYTKNFLGGYTYTESKLDSFSGRLEYNVTTHKRLFEDSEELKTAEIYSYSDQDRLLTLAHFIYGRQVPEPILSNTYDELGQLISKEVGGVQKIDYSYNTRGWLTSINDVNNLQKGTNRKDLFAFQINYNKPTPGGAALYNGNISQTHWKTVNSESVLRNYNYSYDKLNRLTAADFRNNTNAAQNSSYFEKLQYDKNGNITFLHRSGDVVTQTNLEWMDYMIYSYQGNQLTRVKEEGNNHFGFTTSIAQTNTANQYSYDLNGNMTADTNKNITAITYNHLNLPTQITFATTGNIVYIYNAAGQKIQKIVNETGRTAIKTDYLGGYQYDNSVLKFFPTAEGYVEPSGSSYKYIYQYKDHLGNIRLSYDTTLAIKEENNYYPFGLKHEGYNTVKSGVENKYKYNGKELQDELGQNVYAFGWRDYDPTIARFLKIDRFSEKYSELTPYNFTANSPLIYREIAGDSINVSRLMGFDRVTNGNATQRIINDLNAITGLNLSVNQTTGLIEYQRDANGNIVIRETNGTQEGSATARTDLINIINGPEINISGGGRSVTSGNEIAISSQQIDSFVNGTPSQLDNRTLGYGIVIMHEFRHTTAAGGAHDPPLGSNGTGPVVDRVNIYRRELDNNSTTTGTGQFGQRTQYYANPNGNTSSIDFQYQTVNRNGRTVTRNTAITF